MPDLPVGRFATLPEDERVFALACAFPSKGEPGKVLVSSDGGSTWQATASLGPDGKTMPTDSGAFIGTVNGTLIAAFSNQGEMKKEREWDTFAEGGLGWELPTCVVRSLDGGKTWQDLQTLHREWTGAVRDIVQTRDGTIIFTTMKLQSNPERHAVMTYSSTDEGLTWTPSNLLDLGGAGHHGGITEATLVELKDGSLLKYIRTNWGEFWRAVSTDGGRHWHPYGPAGIDASSAPGFLLRLKSGRIALLWNRYLPEGEASYPEQGGDFLWSATPVSNFREELSISLSEDECESWSSPVVIARNTGSEAAYPYAFEFEPGVLWVTAHRFGLKMRIEEGDFLA